MFYLMMHSTHFIYGYMVSDIWLRTILIVRKETRCRHMCYYVRLAAMVLLYALSHRQDSTYHGLCYTSRGALAGTRNSSMGPPHEGSIRRRTLLPQSYILLLINGVHFLRKITLSGIDLGTNLSLAGHFIPLHTFCVNYSAATSSMGRKEGRKWFI